MEATLKIHPDHLRFNPMSRAKKLELKRENIKALIRSKPAGTIITINEFARVCASSEQNTYSMLKTMIKRKDIIRIPSEERGQRYSWAVNEGKVRVAAKAPVARYELATIVDKAKEFAWQKDSDSLRAFITWLEEGKSK